MNERGHGGKRVGSGRPKSSDNRNVKAFRLTDEEFIEMKRVHRLIRTLGVQKVKQILDDIDSGK